MYIIHLTQQAPHLSNIVHYRVLAVHRCHYVIDWEGQIELSFLLNAYAMSHCNVEK